MGRNLFGRGSGRLDEFPSVDRSVPAKSQEYFSKGQVVGRSSSFGVQTPDTVKRGDRCSVHATMERKNHSVIWPLNWGGGGGGGGGLWDPAQGGWIREWGLRHNNQQYHTEHYQKKRRGGGNNTTVMIVMEWVHRIVGS